MKKRSMKIMKAVLLLATVITSLMLYTFIDNQQVQVRTQTIEIDDLPDEFDDFSILQISDLHGAYFGDKQSVLLDAIHSIDYDLIVFTGDMNKGTESDVASSSALIDLVQGLKGEKMYWVDGNCGPYAEDMRIFSTGKLTDMGLYLQTLGVTPLLTPEKIVIGDAAIYLTPKMSWAVIDEMFSTVDLSSYSAEVREDMTLFNQEQRKWYKALNNQSLVLIAVSHYPQQSYLAEETWDAAENLPYDLMIAGHTHGGQIRLPLIGALYIPVVSSAWGGYFPKDADTRGIQYICGIPQYISAGLGSSAAYKWLDFRFFCPPEINQIVLRQREQK